LLQELRRHWRRNFWVAEIVNRLTATERAERRSIGVRPVNMGEQRVRVGAPERRHPGLKPCLTREHHTTPALAAAVRATGMLPKEANCAPVHKRQSKPTTSWVKIVGDGAMGKNAALKPNVKFRDKGFDRVLTDVSGGENPRINGDVAE